MVSKIVHSYGEDGGRFHRREVWNREVIDDEEDEFEINNGTAGNDQKVIALN